MPTLYLATNRVLNFSLGHMQVVRQRDDGVIEEIASVGPIELFRNRALVGDSA